MRIELGYKFILGVFAVIAAVVLGYYLVDLYKLPTYSAFIFALFVGLIIGLTFSRSYTQLFGMLQKQTEAISHGDLSVPVTLGRRLFSDELDDMAAAIEAMRVNLEDLATLIRRASDGMAVASGKLSRDAGNVDHRTEGIATTMQQMSRAATQQNQLVEKVQSRINEMATTLEEMVSKARDAAESAVKTNETAKAGGRVTDRAVQHMIAVFEKMERSQNQLLSFSERTREINKIVEVINGIAQKTNILALNATIEAVRAGDAGRGFAVVADEVRKLAESTAHSAEAIMDLVRGIDGESGRVVETIKESSANINDSRESINDIGDNLSAIIALANETVAKVNEIHRGAQAQVKRGDDVAGLMREISSVTADNVEATRLVTQTTGEQTTLTAGMSAQASDLTRLADNLRNVVARFKLRRERE